MRLARSLAFAPLLLLTACQTLADYERPTASSALVRADGSSAGTVRVFQEPAGLLIRIEASGISPGQHGVHVHAVGRCDAPGFTSAGAHWNPGGRQHGHQNPAGAHLGDLGNVGVGADGRLIAGLLLPRASLYPDGGAEAVRDADGAALVIHAQADDQRRDPSGNSGDRIACALL